MNAREMDILSGEVIVFLLRKLGKETNITDGKTVHLALTVLAMAVSKLFLSIRYGQLGKKDDQPAVIGYFHKWTGLVHRMLTDINAGDVAENVIAFGEQNLSFFDAAFETAKKEKAS